MKSVPYLCGMPWAVLAAHCVGVGVAGVWVLLGCGAGVSVPSGISIVGRGVEVGGGSQHTVGELGDGVGHRGPPPCSR